jgi:hypothetical protein
VRQGAFRNTDFEREKGGASGLPEINFHKKENDDAIHGGRVQIYFGTQTGKKNKKILRRTPLLYSDRRSSREVNLLRGEWR